MCGIAGIIRQDGQPVSREALIRMTSAMVHRGPDYGTEWLDGPVGFGFRRLSILDPAGGEQPLRNEDGSVWAMVNGEIYNHRQLRRELERAGHRLKSQSDAEVVPHLFEEHGIGFLRRLRGMFALALLDRSDGTLFLARDPFGIKPLYYVRQNGAFVFASEIRALLASSCIEPELDLQAVWDYFTFQYVPEGESSFAGVLKLPPAHYLRLRGPYLGLTPYWSLSFEPAAPGKGPSLDEAADLLDKAMAESVRLHLQSDVPVGAYLSSGIDSSAIVAWMREAGARPRTYSLGFAGQAPERDELPIARRTAEWLGTEHHELVVRASDYRDQLPTIVSHQEEPLGDPSAPALYFLSRAARADVRVILSGEGADELFAGYPIYGEPAGLRLFEHLPPAVLPHLRHLAAQLPASFPGRGFLQRGTTPLPLRYYGNARLFLEEEKRALFRPLGSPCLPSQRLTAPHYADALHLDDVAAMQTVDCRTWLPGDILMKADKMSMAHSIELRVPFLDVEVFQLARRLPLEQRLRKGVSKVLLRRTAERRIPREIAQRPKLGFPVPTTTWLRRELAPFLLDILHGIRPDFLDVSYLELLAEQHTGGVADHGRKLWAALVFLLWYDRFRPRLRVAPEGVVSAAQSTS